MTTWQPNKEGLEQVLALFRDTTKGDNERQQEIFKALEKLEKHPEFINYLAFVLARLKTEGEDMRQRIGLHLKTVIKRCGWKTFPAAVKTYVKGMLLESITDPSKFIRATTGSIITSIASADLEGWPGLLQHLVKLLEQNNDAALDGAFHALTKLCEDIPRQLDSEKLGRPLNVMIPRFIRFFAHRDESIRKYALQSVNQFLYLMPSALQVNMDTYMKGLFHLAMHDQSPEIRRRVCQAFVILLEIRLDYLKPHMQNVIKFMLSATEDKNENVALEACEFWTAYCETQGAELPILQRFLPQLVPVLLKGMVYNDADIRAFAEEDAEEPDKESSFKPRFHSARNAAYGGGMDAEDGEDDDDDFPEDEDSSEWNLRKCSAASLDTLANRFRGELTGVLLPVIEKTLNHPDDWKVRESGVLALGAVAEGCFEGLERHLPRLIPFLVRLLQDAKPLIRSITCWTLSRYAKWIMKEKDDAVYFRPLMSELLKRVLDRNKKVQEAACSAFATLEEEANERLLPYLDPIIKNLMHAFNCYQAKNMLILYDAIGTLAEAVGAHLNKPEFIKLLMPPLMNKWKSVKDDDRNIFPLLECLTSVAQALESGFLQFAPPVFARCVKIIDKNLVVQKRLIQARANGGQVSEHDMPDKEFIVCALDLLSGLGEGLGASIEGLVGNSNLLALLFECAKDADPDVRQSAFALLGDLAKSCMGHLKPHLPKFLKLAAENLTPKHISVCNNASWAIGEIAVQLGPEMKPFVPDIMKCLVPIMNTGSLVGSLLENTAITIGRLGGVCPDVVALNLEHIAAAWIYYLAVIKEDSEKVHAFVGLCMVIKCKPVAVLPWFSTFLHAIALWKEPSDSMKKMFAEILHSFKNMLVAKGEWQNYIAKADPSVVAHLVAIYKI